MMIPGLDAVTQPDMEEEPDSGDSWETVSLATDVECYCG